MSKKLRKLRQKAQIQPKYFCPRHRHLAPCALWKSVTTQYTPGQDPCQGFFGGLCGIKETPAPQANGCYVTVLLAKSEET